MDYRVHIDAGKEDCYYQFVHQGATIYASMSVSSWLAIRDSSTIYFSILLISAALSSVIFLIKITRFAIASKFYYIVLFIFMN